MERARDLTYAQLLCEGEMAQIIAGVNQPQSQGDTSIDTGDPAQSNWVYSVDVETPSVSNITGLLAVTVTVHRESNQSKPVEFTLVRWMVDPTLSSSNSSNSSGSGSNSGSSGGSTNASGS